MSYSCAAQSVRERPDGLTAASWTCGELTGDEQQSVLEVVPTLSHDSAIGHDDGRTDGTIREADMPAPPLEIERASQAGRPLPELFQSVGIVYFATNKT